MLGVAAEPVKLVGRDNELARLRAPVVDPPTGGEQVLVVLGDAGLGKTALVAEAARHAQSEGIRVLSTAGSESEANLAFAGLHQLLLPVLDRVDRLPERQARHCGVPWRSTRIRWLPTLCSRERRS